MFVAPVVACEISAPPTTPRAVARSSAAGLTTFMAARLVPRVVQPRQALRDLVRGMGREREAAAWRDPARRRRTDSRGRTRRRGRARASSRSLGVPAVGQPRPHEHAAVGPVVGRARRQRGRRARRAARRGARRTRARRRAMWASRSTAASQRAAAAWSIVDECRSAACLATTSDAAQRRRASGSSRSAGPGRRPSTASTGTACGSARRACRGSAAARRGSAARRTGRPRAARTRALGDRGQRHAPLQRQRAAGRVVEGRDRVEHPRAVARRRARRPRPGRARRRRTATGTTRAPASENACSAARYDGSSTSTTSPGSSSTVAASVSACCEPLRDEHVVGLGRQPARGQPRRDRGAQRPGRPRWSSTAACGRRVGERVGERRASPTASNSSGAGRPPANEITPGRAVRARMSRTGELRDAAQARGDCGLGRTAAIGGRERSTLRCS